MRPKQQPKRPLRSSCQKKPANLLRGLLPKEDGEITVEFDDKNVLFRLKNQVLICRLIEGNYPNYNAVIPANNPNKVFVDRLELLNADPPCSGLLEPVDQPD